MTDQDLLTLVADIVSAHVSHNAVSANDLPTLIQSVYTSFSKLAEQKDPVVEKREPAVAVRNSVKADNITCLECGAKFKMLKRHLMTDHNMTPGAYRSAWDLPANYPLVAPDYAAQRKALAIQIGLGRKPTAPSESNGNDDGTSDTVADTSEVETSLPAEEA